MICEAGQGEATELARRIIAKQWAWLLGEYRGALRLRPSEVLREVARLDHAILGILDGSVVCGAASVRTEVLSFLAWGACPPRALVSLLETAAKTYERQQLRKLVHSMCDVSHPAQLSMDLLGC